MRALAIHRNDATLAELRRLVGRHVECLGARTPDEAIHLVAATPEIALVLVEHVPEPTATQQLASLVGEVHQHAPEALLIVVTSDLDGVRRLDEEAPGRIFRFLGRPDQHEQLAGIVVEALRVVRLEREQRELSKKLGAEHLKLQKRERLLDVVVQERTQELRSAYLKLKEANREALLGLAEAIEAKDSYTKGHCGRVAHFSIALARVCDYPAADMETLEFASFLHDIGKIGIRDAVLLKPAQLDEEEWKHMRQHPVIGDQIASQIQLLAPMRPAIRNHHERWDGKGYPDGMVGEGIPLAARIVQIADAFDAMVTDRPYKRALGLEESYGFLRKGSGLQFDPNLVERFIKARIGEDE